MDSSPLVARLAILGILISSLCWLYAISQGVEPDRRIDDQQLPSGGWYLGPRLRLKEFSLGAVEVVAHGLTSPTTYTDPAATTVIATIGSAAREPWP
ncbi:hypothetical protein BO86DRAFT_399018 [Aspergillus japonicus CBS 114.51]|uniref:Uncharacterized protein n=2 Tax=Aspergillus TaxID=5052 RepID=A0A2V5GYQ4_ASPV1|nr:hypothetical protein BO86DRAFT_399018 [Aspergillus japonicus CBS 114.51]PYI16291.1 hypothetical protein BO99DRAFT_435551 [Aspergillus violaceofuscus CBS 115571]RAH82376.1 hypothetical protein BO86DRAFT_399018 [Aspergillus japonicus CBS 114.51]